VIQAYQEGLIRGGQFLAQRCAMGGDPLTLTMIDSSAVKAYRSASGAQERGRKGRSAASANKNPRAHRRRISFLVLNIQ